MKMITKIISLLIVVYLVIGIINAIKWAKSYDSKANSMPNNATTFVINVLTWPL